MSVFSENISCRSLYKSDQHQLTSAVVDDYAQTFFVLDTH